MDDEEEIQSHASGASGSPSPSPPNGRITVTVAAGPPLAVPKSSAHNALTLALPFQGSNKNNGGGGGGGGGGREDCWSEGATAVLIEAWGERYLELSRGNLKQKHWKEVADIVSGREDYTKTPKTDIQCKNRIDTVKKKYKSEKAKIAAGAGPSKWQFFERLDHLIGPTAKIPAAAAAGPSSVPMSSKVPVAIPVGVRGGGSQYVIQKHQPQRSKNLKNQKLQFRRRGSQMDSEEEESEEEEVSPDSDDSFPPEKKPRVMRREVGEVKEKKGGGRGNSLRLLTQAILKFGEAYEAAESAKLQQVVEMENQRMKFAKDLELQRMQFFMKTQLDISQMKHGRKGVNSGNHHCNNNNNNSDSN